MREIFKPSEKIVFLVAVASLLLARAVLQFEDLLMGSFDGSFWRFAKERLMVRKGRNVTGAGAGGD